MPLIHESWLRAVLYLYPSVDEARSGVRSGGTGFLVESPVDDETSQVFAVSCWHVVGPDLGNARIARANVDSGGVHVLDNLEWQQHQSGDDLAIAPLTTQDAHGLSAVSSRLILRKAEAGTPEEDEAKRTYGPGNEVFFIGRYGFHEGRDQNNPIVRFGTIAQMPEDEDPIWHPGLQVNQESYVLEARSLGGFSGSPVFVNPQAFIDERGHWDFFMVPDHDTPVTHLLGVVWGHRDDEVHLLDPNRHPLPELVRQNTGLLYAVPSWRLLDLLTDD